MTTGKEIAVAQAKCKKVQDVDSFVAGWFAREEFTNDNQAHDLDAVRQKLEKIKMYVDLLYDAAPGIEEEFQFCADPKINIGLLCNHLLVDFRELSEKRSEEQFLLFN